MGSPNACIDTINVRIDIRSSLGPLIHSRELSKLTSRLLVMFDVIT
jgi:hypothetical protein